MLSQPADRSPWRNGYRRAILFLAAVISAAVVLWFVAPPREGAERAQLPMVRIAVAANFSVPLAELTSLFEAAYPYRTETISGSTGALYAQITQGAPFDVFLAADQARPAALEAAGGIVPSSRFTYARGLLALLRLTAADQTKLDAELVRRNHFRTLAIANPRLAPYGAAAREWLTGQGLLAGVQHKLVFGDNVAQAGAMVLTGNAELGLVSLAQALAQPVATDYWPLPTAQYPALEQDAVLLPRAVNNPAAQAFVEFLHGPSAKARIAELGYANAFEGEVVTGP